MKLQILGSGCEKCNKLKQNTEEAVVQSGIVGAIVEKVTDFNEIANMGVMLTPALVIDGEVKSMGKLLSVKEIVKFLSF